MQNKLILSIAGIFTDMKTCEGDTQVEAGHDRATPHTL